MFTIWLFITWNVRNLYERLTSSIKYKLVLKKMTSRYRCIQTRKCHSYPRRVLKTYYNNIFEYDTKKKKIEYTYPSYVSRRRSDTLVVFESLILRWVLPVHTDFWYGLLITKRFNISKTFCCNIAFEPFPSSFSANL